MTTLPEYLNEHGHSLEPVDDASLSESSPGGGWTTYTIDDHVTNVAVWVDESLQRDLFQPTIVISKARITPAADPAVVLDRLDDNAATLPEWLPRAQSRSTNEQGRLVSDSLGDYRLESHRLTASSITTVWNENDSTLLHQVVVTTFDDQLPLHADAVRNLV